MLMQAKVLPNEHFSNHTFRRSKRFLVQIYLHFAH